MNWPPWILTRTNSWPTEFALFKLRPLHSRRLFFMNTSVPTLKPRLHRYNLTSFRSDSYVVLWWVAGYVMIRVRISTFRWMAFASLNCSWPPWSSENVRRHLFWKFCSESRVPAYRSVAMLYRVGQTGRPLFGLFARNFTCDGLTGCRCWAWLPEGVGPNFLEVLGLISWRCWV